MIHIISLEDSQENKIYDILPKSVICLSSLTEYILKGKEQIQCMLDREGKTYWSDDEPRCIREC